MLQYNNKEEFKQSVLKDIANNIKQENFKNGAIPYYLYTFPDDVSIGDKKYGKGCKFLINADGSFKLTSDEAYKRNHSSNEEYTADDLNKLREESIKGESPAMLIPFQVGTYKDMYFGTALKNEGVPFTMSQLIDKNDPRKMKNLYAIDKRYKGEMYKVLSEVKNVTEIAKPIVDKDDVYVLSNSKYFFATPTFGKFKQAIERSPEQAQNPHLMALYKNADMAIKNIERILAELQQAQKSYSKGDFNKAKEELMKEYKELKALEKEIIVESDDINLYDKLALLSAISEVEKQIANLEISKEMSDKEKENIVKPLRDNYYVMHLKAMSELSLHGNLSQDETVGTISNIEDNNVQVSGYKESTAVARDTGVRNINDHDAISDLRDGNLDINYGELDSVANGTRSQLDVINEEIEEYEEDETHTVRSLF